MDKDNRKYKRKARLIALGVALLLLAAAMGITLWQYHQFTAAYMPFNLPLMIGVNCVGALVMYLIVSHFLKKSFSSDSE